MKTAKLFTAIIAATLLFFACGDGDGDNSHYGDFGAIKVPDTRQLEQTVTAGGTQTGQGVTFTTEGAWMSSIVPTRSDESWISISPDRGDAAGSYTIRITLSPNPSEESRTATITILCGSSKIEIVVTQQGTSGGDDPLPPTPVITSQIVCIECLVEDSSIPDESTRPFSYYFKYDDKGRVTAFEWDDTPENTADEIDEVIRISYPTSETIKLEAVQGENTGQTYTATLDNAGRTVKVQRDGRSAEFTYDAQGHCIGCRQTLSTEDAYPLTKFGWSSGNLTTFEGFDQDGKKTMSEALEYTAWPNDSNAMSLDLNALLFQASPSIAPETEGGVLILAGIGRLGKRSANLTATDRSENSKSDEYANEPGSPYRYYIKVLSDKLSWELHEGHVTEVTASMHLQLMKETLATGKHEPAEDSYFKNYTYTIHYRE